MQDRVTTSWKRFSDKARNHADSATAHSAPTLRQHEKEAQLQAWEGEGGKTALSTGSVRILIVDNGGIALTMRRRLREPEIA